MRLDEMVREVDNMPSPVNTTMLLCLELACRQRRMKEESRSAQHLPSMAMRGKDVQELSNGN